MKRFFLFLVIGALLAVVAKPDNAFSGPIQASSTRRAIKRPVSPTPAKAAKKAEEDCGCEATAPPGVIAFANGVKIAMSDVYDPIKDNVQALQNQMANGRQRELQVQIAKRLFDTEAKRRGITREKLLERELAGKVKDPTEAELQAFYEQNKAQIEGVYADVKPQMVGYIRDMRLSEETQKYALRLGAGRVRLLVETVNAPASEADRARVLATVDAQRITAADLEESLAPFIFNIQEQIYELRKKQLDEKINNILFEQAANKQSTTPDALFESEVNSKMRKVSEDEIQKFYQENKAKLGRPLYQVRGQIEDHLQSQIQTEAALAYAEQLRKPAKLQIFLKVPDPPFIKIAIDDQPWTGAANPRVTIVEFTDYECPSCGRTAPVLEEVIKEYADKVKLVVRDFPLDMHAHAFKAALAAEAAREQGKYWEYAAILFKNQTALEVGNLKEYATQLGLDRAKFDQALDSEKYAENLKRDLRDGGLIGVGSTPTVFINGKRIRDKSAEGLKAAIEAALKQSPVK